MNATQLTERMHAVLDGEATPEERRELEAWLENDPAARREFESWRSLFATFSAVPEMQPPQGLVAAVAAALPPASQRAPAPQQISIQLSPRPAVIGSGPVRTRGLASFLSTIVRWLVWSDTTQESWNMNANRKILAGGVAAAAVVGIAMFAFDYPPKSQDVLGTVVPAERYRAPQSGAEAVKLGSQTAVPGTGSTEPQPSAVEAERVRSERVRGEIKAAEVRVAELKAAERAEADRTRVERVRSELKSAELRLADLKALDLRAAEIKAAEAKVVELKTAERVEADRVRAERVRSELKSAELHLADLRALQLTAADRVLADKAAAERVPTADKLSAERVPSADKAAAERTQTQRMAQ